MTPKFCRNDCHSVTYITYDSLDIIIFIKIKKFNQPLTVSKKISRAINFPGRKNTEHAL
jgi:hypothetical protein